MLSKINPSVAVGLAAIEQAQVMEYTLTNKLTGNPGNDGPILQQLQGAFQAGIARNMGLMSLATGGSGVPGAASTSAAMPGVGGGSGVASSGGPLATVV